MTVHTIKVVPYDAPNDDGRWVTVEPGALLAEQLSSTLSWRHTAALLRPLVPAGHCLVSYRRERE